MQFENRPAAGVSAWWVRSLYRSLESRYTVHLLARRPGLPSHCTLGDMADDYAAAIAGEFGGPVDVVGLSIGGLIAQHFAADHPDLTRRLVLHSSAHRLSDRARDMQDRVRELALQGRWRDAYTTVFAGMAGPGGARSKVAELTGRLVAPFGSLLLGRPEDPSDLAVTYVATNAHDFADRLGQIKVPTLVVGGDRDPFFSLQAFRATAEGIPTARLILYHRMGHPVSGKRFSQDLLAFLLERPASGSGDGVR